ncbi:MAG: class I SAM-dependent methyltransferase [Oscillospiraceae bacterium]|nr:class I SAM-dependent methyltransferase [Oscillospiraceae bacterium]
MNKDIFSGKAEVYVKFRPHYASNSIQFLVDSSLIHSDDVIADVGSGTGMLALQIIDYVSLIYGVEPNADMRDMAGQILNGTNKYRIIDGTAENTTLPDHSVDAVTVGQAFHWFDPTLFKVECKRILKKDGPIVLMWNRKTPGLQEDERRAIVGKYSIATDYYNYSWKDRERGIIQFFDGTVMLREFEQPLYEDYETFIGRTLSSSHAIRPDSSNFNQYIDEWTRFFQKFSKDGKIKTENRTVVYWGFLK